MNAVSDPIAEFSALFARAKESESFDAARCVLATVRDSRPSSRLVLLKHVDDAGFVFYTNYTSRKARELDDNPHAALCFHWHTVGVQVRVEGEAERVSDEESNAYFATRARTSQLGAWASRQSTELASRQALIAKVQELEERFPDDVPRPEFWGGFRVRPARIELWYNGEFRLHDRFSYERDDGVWRATRLSP